MLRMKGVLRVETIVEREDYLTQLLQHYRVQRHDFLNHFQVAMGYIQLNKGQKALEYLQRAAEQAVKQAPISRVSTPELAVELMDLSSHCFDLGVEFSFSSAADLPPLHWCSTYATCMDIIRREVQHATGLELQLSPAKQGIILTLKFNGINLEGLSNLAAGFSALNLPVRETTTGGEPALEICFKR